MVEFAVVPSKLALLNVDLQNVFVEGTPISVPDGRAVVARLNRMAAACRQAGSLVVYTTHVTRPDGANVGVLGELFPAVREGLIARGAPLAALHQDVDVRKGDLVLEKPRFGAFHGTDLDLILRARGVDTVIVGGLASNVCAETTAREACVRDYRVFFLSDGSATREMGGVPAEVLQRATCAALAEAFARVLTVDEMVARIEAARG